MFSTLLFPALLFPALLFSGPAFFRDETRAAWR
jgi:hypothetical protein